MRKKKELRRMSRRELVELIYDMKQSELELREKYELLERKWNEREMKLSKVGSLAEAVTSLYGVFDSAQKAADAYVEGVKKAYDDKLNSLQPSEAAKSADTEVGGTSDTPDSVDATDAVEEPQEASDEKPSKKSRRQKKK